jgi:triphosphoribosyl-dephospho-CoA synthetase
MVLPKYWVGLKKFLLKAAVDDTNIVSRAGIEALHWAQAEAAGC